MINKIELPLWFSPNCNWKSAIEENYSLFVKLEYNPQTTNSTFLIPFIIIIIFSIILNIQYHFMLVSGIQCSDLTFIYIRK